MLNVFPFFFSWCSLLYIVYRVLSLSVNPMLRICTSTLVNTELEFSACQHRRRVSGAWGAKPPNFLFYMCQVLAGLFTNLLRSTRCLQWRHFCAILCWVSDYCPPIWTVNCHWYAAKEKKLRQTELTFFKKAEKTDTGTVATYLFTYLQKKQRWQRNLLGGGLEAGPKNVGTPTSHRTCTPIRVCLQTHVNPLGNGIWSVQ